VVHAAQLVQHGAADPVLHEGLERRAAGIVEATRRLQQAERARRPQIVERALQTGAHDDPPGHPIDEAAVTLDQLLGVAARRGVCRERTVHDHPPPPVIRETAAAT
jgi:hypothetical protein